MIATNKLPKCTVVNKNSNLLQKEMVNLVLLLVDLIVFRSLNLDAIFLRLQLIDEKWTVRKWKAINRKGVYLISSQRPIQRLINRVLLHMNLKYFAIAVRAIVPFTFVFLAFLFYG